MPSGWDLERRALRFAIRVRGRAQAAAGQVTARAPMTEWAALPRDRAETIIAGDSIARRIPGRLVKNLGAGPVVNHGWGGDTVADVALRIQVSIDRRPVALALQVGTNDVLRGLPLDVTIATYRAMAERCRDQLPASGIVICALPPIARWRARPDAVRALNAQLRDIAHAVHAEFCDLHAALSTAAGVPLPGVSRDGVHLTADGYRRYVEELSETLPRAKAAV